MIVLAIAGLILAIVFIAVPALQRNSRDAQRRADISALQSAVATFVGNNNGQIPDSLVDLNASADSIDFSFYNATRVAWGAAAAGQVERTIHFADSSGTVPEAPLAATLTNSHDVTLYIEGAQCAVQGSSTAWPVAKGTAWDAGAGANSAAADKHIVSDGPARSYAIVYALESDPNWICIDNV